MRKILVLSVMTFSMTLGSIVIGPPDCMTGILDEPAVLPCSTDLTNPVSWRYKSPERTYAKYLFINGQLKNYSKSLGISCINGTRPGQYDLVFDRIKVESACGYQCQDNDGMDYGPVVELVLLKSPMACAVNRIQDEDNVTIALNLTCSLQYRQKSGKDSFIWYDHTGGRLENCSNSITTEEKWNTVSSTCIIAVTQFQFTTYKFVAGFGKSVSPRSTGDSCVHSWSHTEGLLKSPHQDVMINSASDSTDTLIMYYIISASACLLIVICIVCIVCCVRKICSNPKYIEPMNTKGANLCKESNYGYTTIVKDDCSMDSNSMQEENLYDAVHDYEKARPLNGSKGGLLA